MRKYDKTISMRRLSHFTNYRRIYFSFDKDINSIHYSIYIDRYTLTYFTIFLFYGAARGGLLGKQKMRKYLIRVTKIALIPYSV